jgi:hypothetical protein
MEPSPKAPEPERELELLGESDLLEEDEEELADLALSPE